jgi:hypothetical protein
MTSDFENGSSPIVINEFMTRNTPENSQKIVDEYGEYDDWIELYNPGDDPVLLKGLYLSDKSASLRKFAFFDTVLPSRGYIRIWTDGQPGQGKYHADFKLSATNGDQILLSNGNGHIVDQIQFFAESGNPEARLPNVSYGRSSDGKSTWCSQKKATPLSVNEGCFSQ